MSGIDHRADERVRFGLFGRVRIVRDGVEIEVTQPKQRAILALLLAAAGEPVSLSEMVDTLWSGEPAASVTNQIHRHVGALRRLCEPDLPRRQTGSYILAAGTGYRLAGRPENCDVMRFRSLVAEARRLAGAGRREEALRGYLDALAVAAAPAGDEFSMLPAFVGLEDERVRAVTAMAEQCNTSDEYATALPLLRAAAGRHRLNEAVHAHLMTALTRTGCAAEALAVYAAIRAMLREELGSSPDPVLEEARARALRGEESSPASKEGTEGGRADTVLPAQLPSPAPGFAGRQGQLAALHDEPGNGPGPLLITGMAGVGKTTLALRYAAELAHAYPDGQLCVNLRGFDATAAPTDPLDVLRDMLEGLGVPSKGQPESVDARAGLLRSILSAKRVLVVLDNAHDYQQVVPLLPGAGASRVIITSRHRMPGLAAFHQARVIELEPFDDREILEFFSQRLPLSRVEEDRDALLRLGRACGGLPLAMSIVAARACANPAFPLDLLVREFTQEPMPLAALNAGSAELDLGTVFSWSHRALSEDAAQTFVVLSAHPGPEISTAAAVSLAGLEPRRVREVLTELTLANVLREPRPGRFVFHDLVREYALSLLGHRAADASARVVNHYVRSTRQAILTFGRPAMAPIDETIPGIEPERFSSDADAVRWYVEERHVLHAVCRLAFRLGDHRSALTLELDWRPMSQTVDTPGDLLPITMLGLQAAQHVDEPILKAECYRDAAAKLASTGDIEQARHYFDMAAATFEQLGDRAGLANVYRNMALFLVTDPHEGADLLRQSVSIARQLDNAPVLAASLWALGNAVLYWLDDPRGARDIFAENLDRAISEGLGDNEFLARIGLVASLTRLHEYEAAVREAEPVRARLRSEHRPIDELPLLWDYGAALAALGKDAEAVEVWQRFLDLATPELIEDAFEHWRTHRSGEEEIAMVRSKLDALMSVDQPSRPA